MIEAWRDLSCLFLYVYFGVYSMRSAFDTFDMVVADWFHMLVSAFLYDVFIHSLIESCFILYTFKVMLFLVIYYWDIDCYSYVLYILCLSVLNGNLYCICMNWFYQPDTLLFRVKYWFFQPNIRWAKGKTWRP